MKNRMDPYRGAVLVAVVLLAGLAGCTTVKPDSRVELVSYQDPYFPETFDVHMSECVYRKDASGDLHVVGRATAHDPEHGPLVQYLHVHVYWKPRPGKTYANASAATAVLRYLVLTDDGAAVYDGTGFAYPKRMRGGKLTLDIEAARLHLKSQRGDVPDVLGDARVNGRLRAQVEPAETTDLLRTIDLLANS
jgi:hypothetical protein